jgi:hypothetical protein
VVFQLGRGADEPAGAVQMGQERPAEATKVEAAVREVPL